MTLLVFPLPGASEEFRLSDDRWRVLQFRRAGDALEGRVRLPRAQAVHPGIPQVVNSIAPRSQHPFSGVLKTGEVIHQHANGRGGVCNGVTDSLDHHPLLLFRDAEVGGDEPGEGLTGEPRLLAHQADAGWVVLVPGIDRGREEVVGGS